VLVLLPALVLSAPSDESAQSFEETWNEIRYKGRTYVSFQDAAHFYGLDHKRAGEAIYLNSKSVTIRAQTSSKALVLNGLTFHLSHPVLPWDDRAIVSNFDIVNVIDPILRPTALRDPAQLMTVILDPAHGGKESGIASDKSIEKITVLDLAQRIRGKLTGSTFRVVLTREGDIDLTVEERLMLASGVSGESLFVSLHPGKGNPRSRGLEVFTLPPPNTPATYDAATARLDDSFFPGNINDRENMALAVAVQGQALQQRLVSAGIKRARFPELKGIAVPAIYCRAGFLSNREEAVQLATTEHLDKLAAAFADGIRRYAKVMARGVEQHVLRRSQESLVIADVEVFPDLVRSLQGDQRRLQIKIRANKHAEIDPAKIDLQVYFFDSVNRETLDLSTANLPKVEWISVLPDWKSTLTEVLEVTYYQPPQNAAELKAFGQRFYYGFIVRLVYNGKLIDAFSEPVNLKRCLPHFTPVFP
jgi:N-acetylmuramoyl-L-alanine amidase